MTNANLIIDVRSSCGKVTVEMDELDDAEIITKSNWILNRIGDSITIRALRSITSVANQREYDVPEAVKRVIKVFPWDSADSDLMILGDPVVSGESGSNVYYNFPSMWAIRNMRRNRALPRIRHEFDPINRKLRIDPYPTEAGLKYWYQSADKTQWILEDLPTEMEELVVLGTTWKGLEQIALNRSTLGGVLRETGGRVTYPATELKLFVDSTKKEFKEMLRIKSMLYSR